ncbi:hypothetical protein GQ600_3775 [Phytophthora cactorum]|nr:hypothetical protein GQ600_3775 [Phytophthora cactorum]
MNIAPVSSSGATLTYESEQCSDAYLHPSDNTTDSPLTVTFYPNDPTTTIPAATTATPGILGDYKPGTVIVVREHYGTIGQQYVYGYADINFNLDHLNDNDVDCQCCVVFERHHQLQFRVLRHGRWFRHRYIRQGDGDVFLHTEAVSVSDPVETFSEEGEEVSIVFCVSSYSQTGTQENMVVMNNLNIDYTGADPSPQGYLTADGLELS